MAFLKIFEGDRERTVFLGADPVVIGRGENTHVMIADVKASRQHCVVEPCGEGRYRVRDLGSGNGTKVNGERVEQRVLEPEDVIQAGGTRLLFAGEAVSLVSAGPAREEAPPPGRRAASSGTPWLPFAVLGLVFAAGAAVFWSTRSGNEAEREEAEAREARAYRAVVGAREPDEIVARADEFLERYPDSPRAARVASMRRRARERKDEQPRTDDGYDPAREVRGLGTSDAIARLEEILAEAPPERVGAIRAHLRELRARLDERREEVFTRVEADFREHVLAGRYAQARQMWFYLRGEEEWATVPPEYRRRIVDAMLFLETRAAAERGEIFEEVARAEAAHDFGRAKRILETALPRFLGTSVRRSMEERLSFVERALVQGVEGEPTRAPTAVGVKLEKRLERILDTHRERRFAELAEQLEALLPRAELEEARAEIEARILECRAAAALLRATGRALAAGDRPKGRLLGRYRVVGGDGSGVVLEVAGEERSWPWREVPGDLLVELCARHAKNVRDGALGLLVVAHASGGEAEVAAALERAHEIEPGRRPLHRFVAERVRKEPLPEKGYVVDDGTIMSYRAFVRKREEERIAAFRKQLEESYAEIRGLDLWKKLDRMKARMDALDEARAHALELIFDEEKYFYPYRGTGRMAEYSKVQQEVDHRVEAVRAIWEDRFAVRLKANRELRRALESFDEAAAGLEKRLVDVSEKRRQIDWLRSYLDRRFTVQDFYRTPDELELIAYSDEVMADNAKVQGDITDVEREQVRITNLYRRMFGRWALRLEPKLVVSSRKHCEEMARLGYFGHFSPNAERRTPFQRMKLEGYDYGASENCIMGRTGPQAAHDGWCHSSGHHRNILMPAWTEMGTGHHGRYMTQNYGIAPRRSNRIPARTEETWEWEDEGDSGYDDAPDR